jgi:hypothetical protein
VRSWRISLQTDLGPPAVSAAIAGPPTFMAAVAALASDFDSVVARTLRVGPLAPLPVPQQAVTVRVDLTAIRTVLEGLGDVVPDCTLSVGVNSTGVGCFLGEPHNRISVAATLGEAIGPLFAPDLRTPSADELRLILNGLLNRHPEEWDDDLSGPAPSPRGNG